MSLSDLGYEIIENLISHDSVHALITDLNRLKLQPLQGGIRRIETLSSEVADLATSSQLLSVAEKYLTGLPTLVRAIYFEKSPEHNWFVTWHQDRTVAVSKRFEATGWRSWTLKADVWHVQPPIEVLENMITIRVHLDAATQANGCLKILPASHLIGIVPSSEVKEKIGGQQIVYCEVPAGGAVIMRPHILHASEKSILPLPRRVLHFEYSSYPLPEGIRWQA